MGGLDWQRYDDDGIMGLREMVVMVMVVVMVMMMVAIMVIMIVGG